VDEASQPTRLTPPEGLYPGKLDDKGRLKLAVGFQEYLKDKPLFVTSLDRTIARIYPLSVWLERKKALEAFTGDEAEAAEHIQFNAIDLGSEAQMDSQGRVTFSPELRTELNMAESPVRIYGVAEWVEVITDQAYQQKRNAAISGTPAALTALKKAGFK